MSSTDQIRALTLEFDLPASLPADDDSTGRLSSEAIEPTEMESDRLTNNPESDQEVGRRGSQQQAGHNNGMCALEIAIVAEALKFIASPNVQTVLHDIWRGDIVFWGDIDINATTAQKKATIYARRRTMWAGYARLRVPRYRFAFQVVNFVVLLALFLATLRQSDRDHISVQEIVLDIWFLGFAYAELGTATA